MYICKTGLLLQCYVTELSRVAHHVISNSQAKCTILLLFCKLYVDEM